MESTIKDTPIKKRRDFDKPFVVIVNIADWQRLQLGRHSLVKRMRACPADLTQMPGDRSRELPRDVGL